MQDPGDLVERVAVDRIARVGRLEQRRAKRAADEVEAIALTSLRVDLREGPELGALATRVVSGELDPYTAADELVASRS